MPSRGKGKQPISSKKRQRPAAQSRRDGDDEVDSGEDSGDEEAAQHARLMAEEDDEAEKEAAEPAAERRVRLAKEMIAAMDAAHSRDGQKEAGPSGDVVAEALEEDALRRAGRWRHRAARCAARASLPRIFAGYAARASARRASRSRRTRALLSAAARMVRWSDGAFRAGRRPSCVAGAWMRTTRTTTRRPNCWLRRRRAVVVATVASSARLSRRCPLRRRLVGV